MGAMQSASAAPARPVLPSSMRTGTRGSPTATSSPVRTAWSSCGTTGDNGAMSPAITTSPTPAKWGWVSHVPPQQAGKKKVLTARSSPGLGVGAGGEAAGLSAAQGCPPSPPTPQCSADPPPPSATPAPSANQSSATRSAPSRATTAATASPRAAPPSSAAVRMAFGNGLSSPAAPVSVQPPALPHLLSWMALHWGSLLPVSPQGWLGTPRTE